MKSSDSSSSHYRVVYLLRIQCVEAFSLLSSWHFPFLGDCSPRLCAGLLPGSDLCLLETPLNLVSLCICILKITGNSRSTSTAASSSSVSLLSLDKQNQSRLPTFQLYCGVTLHVWQRIFKCCGKVKNNIFKCWSRIFLSLSSGQSSCECVCVQTYSGDSL